MEGIQRQHDPVHVQRLDQVLDGCDFIRFLSVYESRPNHLTTFVRKDAHQGDELLVGRMRVRHGGREGFSIDGHPFLRFERDVLNCPLMKDSDHGIEIHAFEYLPEGHMRGKACSLQAKKFEQFFLIGRRKGRNFSIPAATAHDAHDGDQQQSRSWIPTSLGAAKIGDRLQMFDEGHHHISLTDLDALRGSSLSHTRDLPKDHCDVKRFLFDMPLFSKRIIPIFSKNLTALGGRG